MGSTPFIFALRPVVSGGSWWTCPFWELPLMKQEGKHLLGSASHPGAEQGTHLLQVSELRARLQLVTSAWETMPGDQLCLVFHTTHLHSIISSNHSADAHPMSAVIHLILIYASCGIDFFFLVFNRCESRGNPCCCCNASLKWKLMEL